MLKTCFSYSAPFTLQGLFQAIKSRSLIYNGETLTNLNKEAASTTQASLLTNVRWLNLVALVTFLFYAGCLLGLQSHIPMEVFDESRNANNAIEMARNGHWFVSYYDGAPDHWNTKPLLLIWMIAGLIKLGVPAMTALRLPSELAALATVAVLYLVGRMLLRSTVIAVWSALLLMTSILFFGSHTAMYGDYDALLCLFTTIYCLAFWVFVEDIDGRSGLGLCIAAVALALAVLTKGVAGVLLLPGLFLYVLLRKKLFVALRDWRFWLALFGVSVTVAGYYKGRDLIDPGYLQAVWSNELSGRYMAVNEGHHRKALFFARVLIDQFPLGTLLLPLGCLFLLRPSTRMSRAYSAAILCAATSLVLMLVLSKSQTKIWYYCGPAIPLLAVFGAIGAAELPDSLRAWRNRVVLTPSAVRSLAFGLTAVLVLASVWTLYQNEGLKRMNLDSEGRSLVPQDQYGVVLESMQRAGIRGPILLVDDGVVTTARFPHYNPIGSFYAKLAADRGVQVLLRSPDDQIAGHAWVATCDPKSIDWLSREHPLKDSRSVGSCVYGVAAR